MEHLGYWYFRLASALRWYWRAQTRFDVHSPFLTEFVNRVYADDRDYHIFEEVAQLRRFWSGQRERVELLELGAPSRTTRASTRGADRLVRDSAIGDPEGRFLFRLALWLRPERIVEFGTNAGISTVYLHAADTRTPLDTVEGNPRIAALARRTFDRSTTGPGLRPHRATFHDWLADRSPTPPRRLLFFLDGDHRYQPTLDYVTALLAEATDESVFVVADIHWSADMERAWEELKRLPRVTASVDTYHFGLLFFREELTGPHLALIPTRYKPWRVGFFT